MHAPVTRSDAAHLRTRSLPGDTVTLTFSPDRLHLFDPRPRASGEFRRSDEALKGWRSAIALLVFYWRSPSRDVGAQVGERPSRWMRRCSDATISPAFLGGCL